MALGPSAMILSAALIAGAVSHGAGRMLSRRRFLHDQPNARSNHQAPTPRSGGIGVFAGWFAAMAVLWGLSALTGAPAGYHWLIAFAFAAFALGVIDDAVQLPARLKLVAQVAIASGFVYVAGAVEAVPLPFIGNFALGAAAPVFTVFWIVAFMNAFNFMDGINGIAAVSAIFVLSALSVAAGGMGESQWAAPALIGATAAFGFLPLNFPKARLFLGDGGSLFIGFLVAALAIVIARGSANLVTPLFTPIAFMPFLFDVAFTLAHRARRRRNLFSAHREHLYQLLVAMGRSHASVTTIYLTAIALSTAFAIIATSLDARVQFVAPFCLFALFLPPALSILKTAQAKGLLEDAAPRSEPEFDGAGANRAALRQGDLANANKATAAE